jgi:hypothetical protein
MRSRGLDMHPQKSKRGLVCPQRVSFQFLTLTHSNLWTVSQYQLWMDMLGQDEQRFWQELLSLEPNHAFLMHLLSTLPKDECLGSHKVCHPQ